jgi:hypothetical protein
MEGYHFTRWKCFGPGTRVRKDRKFRRRLASASRGSPGTGPAPNLSAIRTPSARLKNQGPGSGPHPKPGRHAKCQRTTFSSQASLYDCNLTSHPGGSWIFVSLPPFGRRHWRSDYYIHCCQNARQIGPLSLWSCNSTARSSSAGMTEPRGRTGLQNQSILSISSRLSSGSVRELSSIRVPVSRADKALSSSAPAEIIAPSPLETICLVRLRLATVLALRLVFAGPSVLDRIIGFDAEAICMVGIMVLVSVRWC